MLKEKSQAAATEFPAGFAEVLPIEFIRYCVLTYGRVMSGMSKSLPEK